MRAPGILAVAVGLALACSGPKEGAYCEDNWAQCLDDHTALWCDYGVFRRFSCPGPEGCVSTSYQGQLVNACDWRGTVAGDNCISRYAGIILCNSDRETALKCNGSTWVEIECETSTCITGETGIGTVVSKGSCN